MADVRSIIPFFTDQNVPDSVGEALVDAGHELTWLRDVLDADTVDPIIAVACERSGQVLVTHDTDFRQAAKLLKITQRQYQNSLHRIMLRCPEPDSARRILEGLSLIEAEWELAVPERAMVIEIKSRSFTTLR